MCPKKKDITKQHILTLCLLFKNFTKKIYNLIKWLINWKIGVNLKFCIITVFKFSKLIGIKSNDLKLKGVFCIFFLKFLKDPQLIDHSN